MGRECCTIRQAVRLNTFSKGGESCRREGPEAKLWESRLRLSKRKALTANITFHIGIFTITVIVRRTKKNRHSAQ